MHPQKSYLICATPRSGSYLLCEALTNTGLAGRPAEFFFTGLEKHFRAYWHIAEGDYQQYLAKVFELGTTPNGVFGSKLIWLGIDRHLDKLRSIPGCSHLEIAELFSTLFPDLHYIFITRRDKLRQAISYARALQTNQWLRSKDQTEANTQQLVFHAPDIDQLIKRIERNERHMQNFFAQHRIQPFTVVYEDFVTTYEETAREILHYLNIPFAEPLTFGERRLVRQADQTTEEWVRRYQELQQTSKRDGEYLAYMP